MNSIAIGCDEAACELKDTIKQHLVAQGHAVTDYGTHDGQAVLYPHIAIAVAEAIARGAHARGVLLCGTGSGMAMAANKPTPTRA